MLAQTFLGIFFTERYTDYCHRRFNAMATLRVIGLGEFVGLFDPELIGLVLAGDPEQWRGGEANARFLRAPAGPNSLMVLDGEPHLRLRRLVLPPLHGDAVRTYIERIASCTLNQMKAWPVGRPFPLHTHTQAIALEVILETVVGSRDEHRRLRLRLLVPKVAGASPFAFAIESAMPCMAQSPLSRWLPWIAARREVDRLIYEEIAAHRNDPEGRDDILALLSRAGEQHDAQLTDQELRDQVVSLLVAGHETTAATLAWCVERLLRHPHCLERLLEEITASERETYLDAVINETLRTRPVIDQTVRKLTRPTDLGGYRLPSGTSVAVSILGAHLSDAYENPKEFCPERFLEGAPPPYALVPFGGGVHRCVGASFAAMEIKTVLRTMLGHVRLRPTEDPGENPIRWRRFTVVPEHGARITLDSKNLEHGAAFHVEQERNI